MRKSIILIWVLCMLPLYFSSLLAQSKKMNMADYEKRKMEYIKKEAGLTQAEADKYFPLNNELTQKKFELHKLHRDKIQRIKDNSNISEEEYRKMLEDDLEVKVKEAALDKLYAPRFENVLEPEKLYRAQQAERSFIQKEVNNFRSEQGNRNNQGNSRANNKRR
ncbi:MAG: hypothetical protein WCR50_00855 [Proteiniphilum sp.]|jgi:hypothetical protein|nr:hypothetical protein [Proteiniphilum sp.]MDD2937541.1 hypothetical protein [Proteiniphilum sp.]MDD3076387.1 hypothetical protein [Proteiniphilum sp.]MDD3778628.1 hypothetical protein [Proteiniphilum sp.]MDD3956419.1 hypothetical protein [Proteiniphilum sp.]